jgi:rare lipoprotein A
LKRALALAAALVLAAGCGSAPRKGAYYADDGPPEKVPENIAAIPDAVPRAEPYHRFANRPYTIFGRTYVPAVNDDPLRERGMASWYGRKFHGQKTASGEAYDMFAMSAAHKTLPIPSYARVTSVRDGRSVVVRVNDRGPFHEDRVIDLSYAAAAKLGIAGPGSGLVEIERVFAGAAPAAQAATPAPAVTPAQPEAVVTAEPAGLWVQLGAFSSAENARSFRERMVRDLPWMREPVTVAARDGLHRVRLGPYRSRDEALAIAAKVRDSLGFNPSLALE